MITAENTIFYIDKQIGQGKAKRYFKKLSFLCYIFSLDMVNMWYVM